MCRSSCGSGRAYNTSTKSCDVVIADNETTTTTTEANSSTIIDLKFVPLPYLIGGVVLTIVVIALHFTHHISIMGTMFGFVLVLLQLSAVTVLAVGVIQMQKKQ